MAISLRQLQEMKALPRKKSVRRRKRKKARLRASQEFSRRSKPQHRRERCSIDGRRRHQALGRALPIEITTRCRGGSLDHPPEFGHAKNKELEEGEIGSGWY